jgi:hemolysin type calcium-binding protein
MKKATLTLFAIVAALAPASAVGDPPPQAYNVLLAGGEEANMMRIWLTPDGRQYVIDSVVPLEVGGTVCANPEGQPNELVCEAPLIAGFEVNSGGGDDEVSVAKEISIPVTMRGGSGADALFGGSGEDKLVGGLGDDMLVGGRGADVLYGGAGRDRLFGGPASDVLRGGPGNDILAGGPGRDDERQA